MAESPQAVSEHLKYPTGFLITRIPKGDDHKNNVGKKGYDAGAKNIWTRQVHHILPISSLSDATIYKELKKNVDDTIFIVNCLARTDWDINGKGNVVSLPTKWAFIKCKPKKWNGWPCHLVDHNPHYVKVVSTNLNNAIWKPHLKKAKDCDLDPESLESQLIKLSDAWYKFLDRRGDSNGGTAKCWKDRIKLFKQEEQNKLVGKPWYYPFSMHPTRPSKRLPPPDWSAVKGKFDKFKDYVNSCFTQVK